MIVWSGSRLLAVRLPGCTSLPAPAETTRVFAQTHTHRCWRHHSCARAAHVIANASWCTRSCTHRSVHNMCPVRRRFGSKPLSLRGTATQRQVPARPTARMLLQSAVRRRLDGKQPPPVILPAAALAAELEAVDGLAALPLDARRQHVHWTMVATHNADHAHSSQLTRAGFWKH